MSRINVEVLDRETQEVVNRYVTTIAEADVANYENGRNFKYGNTTLGDEIQPPTYPGQQVVGGIMPLVFDINAGYASLFGRNVYINNLSRFANIRDYSRDIFTRFRYEWMLELYKDPSIPQLDNRRFVCKCQGYKIYVGEVKWTVNLSTLQEDTYRLSPTLYVYDGEGHLTSKIPVEGKGSDLNWTGLTGAKNDLYIGLLNIHNFNPSVVGVTNLETRTDVPAYNIGYVKTGADTESNEYNQYYIVPLAFTIETELWYYGRYSVKYEVEESEIERMHGLVIDSLFDGQHGLNKTWTDDFLMAPYGIGTITATEPGYSPSQIDFAYRRLFDIYVPFELEGDANDIANAKIKFLTLSYHDEEEYTPPKPPKEPTSNIPTNNDGNDGDGDFTGYDDIPSDENDGLNGWSIPAMNINRGLNKSLYIGNEEQIADLSDHILGLNQGIAKLILALDSSFDPTKIIDRVMELPFDRGFIAGQIGESGLEDAVPSFHGEPLCYDPVQVSKSTAKIIMSLTGGMDVAVIDSFISALGSGEGFLPDKFTIPGLGTPKYYKRIKRRFIELPYGSKTITRMFGNSLDFENTDYILNLPFTQPIRLDPNMLFRLGDGTISSSCELEIKGIMDLESGDVLFNVTANGNMVTQQTVNMSVDRTLNGDDEVSQLRGMLNVLDKTLTAATSTAIGTAAPSGTSIMKYSGSRYQQIAGNNQVTSEYSPWERRTDRYNYTGAPAGISGAIKEATDMSNLIPTPVNVCGSGVSGSIKLVANLLPFLDIYYPITSITENWRNLRGLVAVTDKEAPGYNRYAEIDQVLVTDNSIDILKEERDALISALKGGFYL